MRAALPSWLNTLVLAGGLGSALAGCGGAQSTEIDDEAIKAGKYHYQLAYGHYFNENGSQGEAALQEVLTSLDQNPLNPDAHMLAGLIFMGRERYVDAITHFERAIELRPDFYPAMNNLGTTRLALEQWDKAIEIFEKLVANLRYSTPGHGHNNLGWAWYQKGDLAKARRHFTAAIQLAPALCPPYNNLGMVLIDLGEDERAAKYLRRGLKACPAYAEPHYHLGRLKTRLADSAAAREHFEACIRLSGDAPLAERCERLLAASTAPMGQPELSP